MIAVDDRHAVASADSHCREGTREAPDALVPLRPREAKVAEDDGVVARVLLCRSCKGIAQQQRDPP